MLNFLINLSLVFVKFYWFVEKFSLEKYVWNGLVVVFNIFEFWYFVFILIDKILIFFFVMFLIILMDFVMFVLCLLKIWIIYFEVWFLVLCFVVNIFFWMNWRVFDKFDELLKLFCNEVWKVLVNVFKLWVKFKGINIVVLFE